MLRISISISTTKCLSFLNSGQRNKCGYIDNDPEDRPTNPPVELADNEDELDSEELDQPRQQKQGKSNIEDTQQGGNVKRSQNVDLRSQPERHN